MTDVNRFDSSPPSDRVVEIQRSQSSKVAPDGENDAPAPVSVAMMEKKVVEESAATDDEQGEEELRNAIERDLLQLSLELTEIETTHERLKAKDVEEEGKDGGKVKIDDLAQEEVRKDAEVVEYEDYDEGGAGGSSGNVTTNVGSNSQGSNRRRMNFPVRPDAGDCSYYVKFGSCKFGSHCKFNHPPRRKNQSVKGKANHKEENSDSAGQTRCKYYMTSEGCKYGSDCRYYHGKEKLSTSRSLELNFLGLPIRPREKECPYYMRNGSCKYGSTCRFHHPEPSAAAGSGSTSGQGNNRFLPSQLVSLPSLPSRSSPRPLNENSASASTMLSPTQNTSPLNQEWKEHKAASYPTSEGSLPITPQAFAMSNQLTEIPLPTHQHNMIVEGEYPERPGEPECSFFMQNGYCKFKSNCKFHHPRNRISRASANSFALNDKGLPLRPDHPICTHYQRYGICKYGPACKYDHPPQFSIMGMATPFGELASLRQPDMFQGTAEAGKANGR